VNYIVGQSLELECLLACELENMFEKLGGGGEFVSAPCSTVLYLSLCICGERHEVSPVTKRKTSYDDHAWAEVRYTQPLDSSAQSLPAHALLVEP